MLFLLDANQTRSTHSNLASAQPDDTDDKGDDVDYEYEEDNDGDQYEGQVKSTMMI